MSLAEYDGMIEAFAPDRTDQPFSMSILPRRSRRRRPVTYAHRAGPSGKGFAIAPITIAPEIPWCLLPATRLSELPCNPFGGRMSRSAEPQDLPPVMSHNQKACSSRNTNSFRW
jgi:hypothetical protein